MVVGARKGLCGTGRDRPHAWWSVSNDRISCAKAGSDRAKRRTGVFPTVLNARAEGPRRRCRTRPQAAGGRDAGGANTLDTAIRALLR
ncbi:hypothetical protein GCM10010518_15680 [Kitasatospora cinereorecta]